MALITCSECGKQISDKAAACPGCGCTINHTILDNGSTFTPDNAKKSDNGKANLESNTKRTSTSSTLAIVSILIAVLVSIMIYMFIANHTVADSGSDNGRKYPDTPQGVSDALNDTQKEIIQQTRINGQNTDWLNQGSQLEQNRDWNGLLKHAVRWTNAEPNNSTAWYCLGSAYQNKNSFTEALSAYKRAVTIDPSDVMIWNNLGLTYWNLHQAENSINAFKQAINLKPDFVGSWLNMCVVYYTIGDIENFKIAFIRAKELDPEKTEELYRKLVK